MPLHDAGTSARLVLCPTVSLPVPRRRARPDKLGPAMARFKSVYILRTPPATVPSMIGVSASKAPTGRLEASTNERAVLEHRSQRDWLSGPNKADGLPNPDPPSMTEQIARQFERDGFCLLEGFFPDRLMNELEALSHEHFGSNPAFEHNEEFLDKSQTDVIPWFPQNEAVHAFDAIDEDPRLRRLTAAVLGDGWRSESCMVMFSMAGSKGQAWHQDCPPDDENVFNLNRLVYTRDIRREAGGEVVVVRGSHRRGLLPAGDPTGTFDDEVLLRPKKGSLLLLHGHAWHRVLPVKGMPRLSINYRALPPGAADGITDVCVYRNMRYRFSTAEVVEDRTNR